MDPITAKTTVEKYLKSIGRHKHADTPTLQEAMDAMEDLLNWLDRKGLHPGEIVVTGWLPQSSILASMIRRYNNALVHPQ